MQRRLPNAGGRCTLSVAAAGMFRILPLIETLRVLGLNLGTFLESIMCNGGISPGWWRELRIRDSGFVKLLETHDHHHVDRVGTWVHLGRSVG